MKDSITVINSNVSNLEQNNRIFLYRKLKQLLINLIFKEQTKDNFEKELVDTVSQTPNNMTWLFGLNADENIKLNSILYHHENNVNREARSSEQTSFSR